MRTRGEGPSLAAATSCACASRPAGAARAARTVEGSDPPVRGPGTGSEPGVLVHPRPPTPSGRYRTSNPSGKGVERRFEAAEDPLAGRAVRHRRPRPGRAPSRLAVWPSRTGLMDRERPQARVGMEVHIPSRSATCGIRAVHVRNAFSCTSTPMSHVRLWIGIGRVENRLQVTASHSMIVTLRIGCQTARFRLHFGEDTTRSEPFLLADTASLREVS